MTTPAGPLSLVDRNTMRHTADMLALLPLPGCRDLSVGLGCLADSPRPTKTQIDSALAQAEQVRRTLLAEATPDRWASEVAEFGEEVVADLISTRQAQAAQVAAMQTLLAGVTRPVRLSH